MKSLAIMGLRTELTGNSDDKDCHKGVRMGIDRQRRDGLWHGLYEC